MLNLKKVVKIRILTTEKHRKDLITALYSFGLVQIVNAMEQSNDRPVSAHGKIADALVQLRSDDKPIAEYADIAEALVYLRSVMRKYDIGPDPEPYHGDISEITCHKEDIEKVRAALRSFEEKVARARDALAVAEKAQKMLSGVAGSGEEILMRAGSIRNPRMLFASFLPSADKANAISLLMRTQASVFESAADKAEGAPIGFVYPQSSENEILAALEGNAVVVAGPFGLGKGETFAQRTEAVNSAEQSARKQLEAADSEFRQHLLQDKEHYLEVMSKLETLSSLATLPLKFSKSGKVLVVEGWVPEELYHSLERRMNERLRNVVQMTRLQTVDVPPTMLDNPDVAQPFEFFVNFFSTPYYAELDPTAFITLTFPLFFGLILGDIGYGLIGIAIALLMMLKLKGAFMQNISRILLFSSISTVLFGFLFAEFFGLEEIFGYELHPYILRTTTQGISVMMGVCLAIGAAHLLLGYVLGLMNALREHEREHALAKLSWIVFELSLVGLFISYSGVAGSQLLGVPVATLGLACGAAALAALLSLVKLEGMAGFIEIFGLISNIFSYLRLIALGVSGAILAMVISGIPIDIGAFVGMFAGTHPFDLGVIFNVVAFGSVMVLGHILAFGLGLFESSIQSLRLHYVEFFSKFYHGGGIGFNPLRKPAAKRRGLNASVKAS
jgi:V/A-type H+-transporting ATPase subunit I